MKEPRQPLEHVPGVNEGVEGEGGCNDNHPYDYDHKCHFGTKELAGFSSVFQEKFVMILTHGFGVSLEEVTTSPQTRMTPKEDPIFAVIEVKPVK